MKVKFILRKYRVFLIFFVYQLIIHLSMDFSGDDGIFSKVLLDYNLIDFWNLRYYSWSSRNLIETILVIVAHFDINVWRFLDSINFTFIAIILAYFLNDNNNTKFQILICIMLILYPISQMSTAGWVATTINYSWPLTMMLIALIPCKKILNNKKMNKWELICYLLATLFAINQEQVAGMLLLIYVCTIVYFRLNKFEIKILLIQFFMMVCSILYTLMCPGNSIRKETEIINWMKEYPSLSIMDKTYLGITDTINHFFITENGILIIFCSVLFYVSFIKGKNVNIGKWTTIIPCICISIGVSFPYLIIAEPITVENCDLIKCYIPFMVQIIFLVCILFSIYFIYGISEKLMLLYLILGVGFASRIVMGFSPTLYASSTRTFIYLYFSIIFVSLFIIKDKLLISESGG